MTDDPQSEARRTARALADEYYPGTSPVDSVSRDGFVLGYLAHASIDAEPPVGTVLLCTAESVVVVFRRFTAGWCATGDDEMWVWSAIVTAYPTRVVLVPKS